MKYVAIGLLLFAVLAVPEILGDDKNDHEEPKPEPEPSSPVLLKRNMAQESKDGGTEQQLHHERMKRQSGRNCDNDRDCGRGGQYYCDKPRGRRGKGTCRRGGGHH